MRNVVLNSLMQSIETPMSQVEKEEAGPIIYAARQKVKALKDDFKLLKKEKSTEIEMEEGIVDLLCSQYNRGVKEIQVMVDETLDEKNGVVKFTRQDTGEVLREREATASDLQADMFAKNEEKSVN